MDLKVTTESDTYAYATSPIRFAGLDPEDMIILVLPMAVGSTADFQPLVSMALGIFCLWLYKQATANQPSGFLSIWLSSIIGDALHLPFFKKNKAARGLLLILIRALNQIWINSGLLPTPSYCNLYER